ncbi:uncharacterized protein [Ptychodera flava]|uniref:uncharacterized protein n=1 Tax=Ptychodera flava TaxID=63121 RepID=UPI00396A3AF9
MTQQFTFFILCVVFLVPCPGSPVNKTQGVGMDSQDDAPNQSTSVSKTFSSELKATSKPYNNRTLEDFSNETVVDLHVENETQKDMKKIDLLLRSFQTDEISHSKEIPSDYTKESSGSIKQGYWLSFDFPWHIFSVFIDRKESNTFLHRSKRRAELTSGEGPPPSDAKRLEQIVSGEYKDFKFGFPPRYLWWPETPEGTPFWKNCVYRSKVGTRTEEWFQKRDGNRKVCTWEEVYEYHVKFHDRGWSFELASVLLSYIKCLRGNADQVVQYCPDPCKHKPCTGPHMKGCENVGSRDAIRYNCICDDGYFFNTETKVCEDIKVCGTPEEKCMPGHTSYCEDKVGLDHDCICETAWMGDRCEVPYDACIDFSNPCGVNGRCIPHEGQRSWSCQCEAMWGDDPEQPGRDCNRKNNMCEDLICFNGATCVSSRSGKRATCFCAPDWEGDDCRDEKPLWTMWFPWTQCSVSCGRGGRRTRRRFCDHKKADFCGRGTDLEEEICIMPLCLIDGEWGPWQKMSECSHNCGGGKILMTRNCFYDTDDPDAYGKPCPGQPIQYENCNTATCPDSQIQQLLVDVQSLARSIIAQGEVTGDWGVWTSWTECSSTCGEGYKQRNRDCLQEGGDCGGAKEDYADCYESGCEEANGMLPWNTWSVWSSCGSGTPTCTRTRHCPYGDSDPDACPGESIQQAQCAPSQGCTGEDPSTILDASNVMGPDVANTYQSQNVKGDYYGELP